MKRKVSVVTALMLAFIMIMPTVLMARPIDTVEHRYVEGVRFVPLRLTAYAYGAEVEWGEETRLVYITGAAGESWTISVPVVGGFIEDGTSWVTYTYALSLFDDVEVQEPVTEEPILEEPAQRPEIHGLLSRIEYGENVAYIFGSMHLGRPDWFPLADVVEDAMARADVFAFEFDLALMEDPAVAEFQDELVLLPEGTTLEDVLTEQGFINLMALLESSPLGVEFYDMLESFTPVGANLVITMVAMMTHMNVDAAYSVDSYVMQFAVENNRSVIGLNDVFREVELQFDVPIEIQATVFDEPFDWDELVEVILDLGLAEIYESQDITALRNAMTVAFDADEPSPFVEHTTNINFNVRCHIFADEIARLLQETAEPTTFFVTVGIAHILGGELGTVLDLLEGMGFDVEALWN